MERELYLSFSALARLYEVMKELKLTWRTVYYARRRLLHKHVRTRMKVGPSKISMARIVSNGEYLRQVSSNSCETQGDSGRNASAIAE